MTATQTRVAVGMENVMTNTNTNNEHIANRLPSIKIGLRVEERGVDPLDARIGSIATFNPTCFVVDWDLDKSTTYYMHDWTPDNFAIVHDDHMPALMTDVWVIDRNKTGALAFGWVSDIDDHRFNVTYPFIETSDQSLETLTFGHHTWIPERFTVFDEAHVEDFEDAFHIATTIVTNLTTIKNICDMAITNIESMQRNLGNAVEYDDRQNNMTNIMVHLSTAFCRMSVMKRDASNAVDNVHKCVEILRRNQ